MARHLHGRYTILGKLADGGMAEIFLAVQHGAEGFEKHVVLKRILTQFSADPQFRNMLLDEAHISMSLQHSNIVQVLDLGVAGGRYFLVLELIDGWDLERILQRAVAAGMVWPAALALFVTSQVCRALAYAHAKTREGKPLGIVHRDISPNNVLISEHGEVKLADFGIAKAQRKREQTAAGVIKGKVAYMSPEQGLGSTTIDKRSDIFSVGSMLYRMMTEKLPFEAPTDLEQLLKVQKAQFPPPEESKATVGPAVSSIIMRAMRLAPSERYQSADEMLADVERVLRNDFHSAGQTELKLWLEQLARRDEAQPIGKRRVDTSGIVKDILGTDLSAGTSFELDDLEQVVTGATEISTSPPTPGPLLAGGASPPPLPASAVGAKVVGKATDRKRHRRFGGFWLGAFFAIAAIVGVRYLIVWAQDQGYFSFMGLHPTPPPRPTATVAGNRPGPTPPAPSKSPPPPPPAPPPPSVAAKAHADAGAVPPPVVAAPTPAAAPDAGPPHVAVAPPPPPPTPTPVVKDAGAPSVEAKAPANEEPDEEQLLRQAVPDPESQVIGEEEAEPPPAPKAPASPSGKHPSSSKPAPPPAHPAPPPPPKQKPASPWANTVVLHISTVPVGAVVRVKSHVLGRTPINLHFRSDNVYDIIFVKSGYQPLTKRVSITGKKDRKLAVALKKRGPPRKRSFFHPHR
jgi:serine/threonine-protein kinase